VLIAIDPRSSELRNCFFMMTLTYSSSLGSDKSFFMDDEPHSLMHGAAYEAAFITRTRGL
jgi:hypothetical protein